MQVQGALLAAGGALALHHCTRMCACKILQIFMWCYAVHSSTGNEKHKGSLNAAVSISIPCSRCTPPPPPPCPTLCFIVPWTSTLPLFVRPLCLSYPVCPQAPQPLVQAEAHGSFCEFPAINPAQRGQAYRYAYCLSAVRPTNMGNALSKLDLQTGAALTWHSPGGAVGELGAWRARWGRGRPAQVAVLQGRL